MIAKMVALISVFVGLCGALHADEVKKPTATGAGSQSSAASSAAPQSVIKSKTKSNQSND